MYTEEKEVTEYHSLREQFLKDLNKQIQIDSYTKDETMLRKTLRKMVDKGELF
jgi:hypothetical protein